MPKSNSDRLQPVYREWAKGNFRAGEELFAPDVSFEAVPDGRRATGRQALADFMRDFLAQWSDYRIEAKQIDDRGDEVVVTERQRGTGKASGIELEMAACALWTFRDGQVTSVRWMVDRPA